METTLPRSPNQILISQIELVQDAINAVFDDVRSLLEAADEQTRLHDALSAYALKHGREATEELIREALEATETKTK